MNTGKAKLEGAFLVGLETKPRCQDNKWSGLLCPGLQIKGFPIGDRIIILINIFNLPTLSSSHKEGIKHKAELVIDPEHSCQREKRTTFKSGIGFRIIGVG